MRALQWKTLQAGTLISSDIITLKDNLNYFSPTEMADATSVKEYCFI